MLIRKRMLLVHFKIITFPLVLQEADGYLFFCDHYCENQVGLLEIRHLNVQWALKAGPPEYLAVVKSAYTELLEICH